MRTNDLLPAFRFGQRMSRNLGKILKLRMPEALQINAQLTHPLYDGSRKPKKERPGTQRGRVSRVARGERIGS
jgi:hypothetical protein